MTDGDPPTRLDADAYPRGPNGMALLLEDRIAELEEFKAACSSREERRPINQQLHTVRRMLRWCKTRAGYMPTPKDLGLISD